MLTLDEDESDRYKSIEGPEANKQNFVKLLANDFDVVSVFTHGYYNPCKEVDIFNQNNRLYGGKYNYIDPGIKNGLVFAGVNDTTDKEQDCILFGNEIAALDMNDTYLTILAACESGLGDIKGSEGVFGLQRAFKMAGSEYILNSLWEVDIKSSNLFIKTFFEKYYKLYPTDIYKAYSETVRFMREEWKNPYYWAPYELIR
jgi:CHAT domain-containing protein